MMLLLMLGILWSQRGEGVVEPAEDLVARWIQEHLAAEQRALSDLTESADAGGIIYAKDPRYNAPFGRLLIIFRALGRGDTKLMPRFKKMGMAEADVALLEKDWWDQGAPAALKEDVTPALLKDARYRRIAEQYEQTETMTPADAVYFGRLVQRVGWRRLARLIAQTYLGLSPEGRRILDRLAEIYAEVIGYGYETDAHMLQFVVKTYGFKLAEN